MKGGLPRHLAPRHMLANNRPEVCCQHQGRKGAEHKRHLKMNTQGGIFCSLAHRKANRTSAGQMQSTFRTHAQRQFKVKLDTMARGGPASVAQVPFGIAQCADQRLRHVGVRTGRSRANRPLRCVQVQVGRPTARYEAQSADDAASFPAMAAAACGEGGAAARARAVWQPVSRAC